MSADPLELILTQLRLECINPDPDGLLARLPCPDPDEIAAVYLYEHLDGVRLYAREDLPPRLRDQISAVPLVGQPQAGDPDRTVGQHRTVEEHRTLNNHRAAEDIRVILARHLGGLEVEVFETYVFERLPEPDPSGLVHARQTSPGVPPHFVIEQGGRVVSACYSARENDEGAECYTLTEEGHRRRGYGALVTQAWARHVLLAGKIPFYSHHADNHASRALAASLGVSWKFRVVTFTA